MIGRFKRILFSILLFALLIRSGAQTIEYDAYEGFEWEGDFLQSDWAVWYSGNYLNTTIETSTDDYYEGSHSLFLINDNIDGMISLEYEFEDLPYDYLSSSTHLTFAIKQNITFHAILRAIFVDVSSNRLEINYGQEHSEWASDGTMYSMPRTELLEDEWNFFDRNLFDDIYFALAQPGGAYVSFTPIKVIIGIFTYLEAQPVYFDSIGLYEGSEMTAGIDTNPSLEVGGDMDELTEGLAELGVGEIFIAMPIFLIPVLRRVKSKR